VHGSRRQRWRAHPLGSSPDRPFLRRCFRCNRYFCCDQRVLTWGMLGLKVQVPREALSGDIWVSATHYLHASADHTKLSGIAFRLNTPVMARTPGARYLPDLANHLTPAVSIPSCPAHDDHDQKVT